MVRLVPVADRDPLGAIAVAGHCMKNGVIIGRTNRSFEKLNNTICLSPALIATRDDIDTIVEALDGALTELCPSA